MTVRFRILFVVSLMLFSQAAYSQKVETLKGRLIWNLFEFESFYALGDSLQQMYRDTIEHYRYKIETDDASSLRFLSEYDLTNEYDLMYQPCRFIETDIGKRIRVFFNDKSDQYISEFDWFNKMKKDKIHTFIEIEANRISETTYICEKIVSVDQRLLVAKDR